MIELLQKLTMHGSPDSLYRKLALLLTFLVAGRASEVTHIYILGSTVTATYGLGLTWRIDRVRGYGKRYGLLRARVRVRVMAMVIHVYGMYSECMVTV